MGRAVAREEKQGDKTFDVMHNNALPTDHIWCVIPVYNNRGTVRDVAIGCQAYLNNVLVVDDGSTDVNVSELLRDTGITVLKHDVNKGKGKAILTGLNYVQQRGGRFMITIDADGQHYPKDLKAFIPLLQEDETSILIGSRRFDHDSIPGRSRFGRSLSNFWLRVETGISIDDCQSGFRAYPVRHVSRISTIGAHYDFETEVLTRAAWAGLELRTVEIDVWYPDTGRRISSFRPWVDNFRISCMHARLVGRRLLPIPHRRLIEKPKVSAQGPSLRHPAKLLRYLLQENAAPGGLAVAAGVGVFLATLPLVSVHTLAIAYVATRLHLNKVMALAIQNLCIPPFVPFACIQVGHYFLHGNWLTDFSLHAAFGQLRERLFEWLLGSFVVAPILAVAVGFIVLFIARPLEKKISKHGTDN